MTTTTGQTGEILESSASLTVEQLLAPTGHSFGSLRGTLVHILDSECGWRMLWEHKSLASFDQMKGDDFPGVQDLRRRWNEEERAMRDYISRLGDEDLCGCVRYTGDAGQMRERVLWHCMLHVVNHGTHHRSQAAAILKGLGRAPVALDFTLYLNEKKPGS